MGDQFQLFLPGEMLELPLPGHGGLFGGTFFPVHQLHRQAAAGIFGALSGAVRFQPFLHIGGDAGIEGIIPAPKKSYSLRLPTRYTSEFVQNEKEIHSKDSIYLKEYINPANLDKKRAEGVGYIYTVRSGDNLGLIAKRNRCTVKEIMKWNKLNSTIIRPGQKLRIEKPKPRA